MVLIKYQMSTQMLLKIDENTILLCLWPVIYFLHEYTIFVPHCAECDTKKPKHIQTMKLTISLNVKLHVSITPEDLKFQIATNYSTNIHFFVETTIHWNQLPDKIVHAGSVEAFKTALQELHP